MNSNAKPFQTMMREEGQSRWKYTLYPFLSWFQTKFILHLETESHLK